MKMLFTALSLLVIISCKERNQTGDNASRIGPDSGLHSPSRTDTLNADTLTGCYMKVAGTDTAILMIDQKGDALSGKLMYDNYQVDGSQGTVKGILEGDILKLYYDFDAEGMHSVMEVYFKVVPGGLLRGMGDMNVKTDTAYFISGINYSVKEAFGKIDCSRVNHKF